MENDSTPRDIDAAEATLRDLFGACSPGDMDAALAIGHALVAEVRRLREIDAWRIAAAKRGRFCPRGVEDCYCGTGYPRSEMCPDCRDEPGRDVTSYCVCGPHQHSGNEHTG